MVQVIKKTKIDGEVHESIMTFSDSEWALIQKHYPFGGVSFSLAGAGDQAEKKIKPIKGKDKADEPKAEAGREADDDKPNMKDYNYLKMMATDYFNEKNWEKAQYYFEAAKKLKSFGWLTGKINQCIKNAEAEAIATGKK